MEIKALFNNALFNSKLTKTSSNEIAAKPSSVSDLVGYDIACRYLSGNKINFSGGKKIDDAKLKELYEQGKTPTEIAEELKCSIVGVYSHLRILNLKTNLPRPGVNPVKETVTVAKEQHKLVQIDEQEIKRLLERGLSQNHILLKAVNNTIWRINNFFEKFNQNQINEDIKQPENKEVEITMSATEISPENVEEPENKADEVVMNITEKSPDVKEPETKPVEITMSASEISPENVEEPEKETVKIDKTPERKTSAKKELLERLSDKYLEANPNIAKDKELTELILFYCDNKVLFEESDMEDFLTSLDSLADNKTTAKEVKETESYKNLHDIMKKVSAMTAAYKKNLNILNQLGLCDLYNKFSNTEKLDFSTERNLTNIKHITTALETAKKSSNASDDKAITELKNKLTYYSAVMYNEPIVADAENYCKRKYSLIKPELAGKYIIAVSEYQNYLLNGNCNSSTPKIFFDTIKKNYTNSDNLAECLIELNNWFSSDKRERNSFAEFNDIFKGKTKIIQTYTQNIYINQDTKIMTYNDHDRKSFVSTLGYEAKQAMIKECGQSRAQELFKSFEEAMKKTAGDSQEPGIKKVIYPASANYPFAIKIKGHGNKERVYSTPENPYYFNVFNKKGIGHK